MFIYIRSYIRWFKINKLNIIRQARNSLSYYLNNQKKNQHYRYKDLLINSPVIKTHLNKQIEINKIKKKPYIDIIENWDCSK